MDLKELRKVLDDFLYYIAASMTSDGVVCLIHHKEPLFAYLTGDGLVGRQHVQVLRRPPGFEFSPYLFRIVLNMPGEGMPFEMKLTGLASKVKFSDRQGFVLTCMPEEMSKEMAAFVSMRMMCDARPDDLPFVLCPVATCTPPMSKEVWTVNAFKADEKACLLALNEIADKEDPLA